MAKEYEVEAVTGRRVKDGNVEFLLQWKNYKTKTWTPEENCDSCRDLIEAFEKAHPPAQGSSTPASTGRARSSGRRQSTTSEKKDSKSTPSTRRSRSQKRGKTDNQTSSDVSEGEQEEAPALSKQTKRKKMSEDKDSKSTPNTRESRSQRRASTSAKGVSQKTFSDDSEGEQEKASTSSKKTKRRRQSTTTEDKDAKSTPNTRGSRNQGRAGKTETRATSKSSSEGEEDAPASSKKAKRTFASITSSGKKKASHGFIDFDDTDSDDTSEKTEKPVAVKKQKVDGRRSVATRASLEEGYKTARDEDSSDDKNDSVANRKATRGNKTASERDLAAAMAKLKSSDPHVKLQEALTWLVLTDPLIDVIRLDTTPGAKAEAFVVHVPPKMLMAEDLPGIHIWNEKSYLDAGNSIAAANGENEKFGDRQIINILGYVPDDTSPFVLIKVEWKKEETKLRVKDAVQAVHFDLAERIFPKIFKAFMDCLVTQPSGPTGTDDGAGPSGSADPATPGTSGTH